MNGTTKSTNNFVIKLPKPTGRTQLDPAPTYDVTKLSDERTQTLDQLLKKGHAAVAPLREPKLILHSHLPHLLGSAYALGANKEQLVKTYEHEVTTLVNKEEGFVRGDKISRSTWRDFLQKKDYTVAYVDFFDREVAARNGDWKAVVEEFLYATSEPIINGYTGGLGHPFIHLAYAYEFQSKEVATEALSLGCTEFFDLHGLIDHPPPSNATYKTKSLADIMERVRTDKRFDGLLKDPGITNFGAILTNRFNEVLEHWNAWEVEDPVEQFEHCCDLSVLLALSDGDPEKSFDFYNVHLMTVAHALRILWQHFPPERHIAILKQYALFTILIYIAQLRPGFDFAGIESVDTERRDWDWVVSTAISHKWALDSHFFKVVRAPKAFAETYGEKDDFYLKASIKFVTEFRGWEGFGLGVEGFLPSRDGYIPE